MQNDHDALRHQLADIQASMTRMMHSVAAQTQQTSVKTEPEYDVYANSRDQETQRMEFLGGYVRGPSLLHKKKSPPPKKKLV